MPLSVLIIEDNPDSADSLAEIFRLSGHSAHVARNGREAVEVAVHHPPDVAVVDVVLPDIDGYTAAKWLLGVLGRRPMMIALTGFEGMEGWSRNEGFDHHLVKPADPSTLIELLRQYESRMGANA